MSKFQARDNPSFVLRAPHDVFYEDREVTALGSNDVIVEVKKTGICGSDIHYYAHGGSGSFKLAGPMILGHESSGVVVDIGEGVEKALMGKRVALEPGAGCFNCVTCRQGRYHLCEAMQFAATPPFTRGTLTRYYTIPAFLAHPIPEEMTMEDGAMIEPLSVAVHALLGNAAARAGYNFVVLGAGPVGLLCMAVAKATGSQRIIAVDLNEDRLKFAKGYAADETYLMPKAKEGEARPDFTHRVAEEMKAQFGIANKGPSGIDIVVDCTGAEVPIQVGMYLCRDRGQFVQVGNGAAMHTIPLMSLMPREVTIVTSFRYGPGDFETAINLVTKGLVDLKPLVSHQYKFNEAEEAFKSTEKGVGADGTGIIKAIINGPE